MAAREEESVFFRDAGLKATHAPRGGPIVMHSTKWTQWVLEENNEHIRL